MSTSTDRTIVCDTPESIAAFQALARYHAARLQLLGLRHSSGRSVIALLKREHGLKGSNASVVEQYAAILRDAGILR